MLQHQHHKLLVPRVALGSARRRDEQCSSLDRVDGLRPQTLLRQVRVLLPQQETICAARRPARILCEYTTAAALSHSLSGGRATPTSASRTRLLTVTVELPLLLLSDLPCPEGPPVVLKRDVSIVAGLTEAGTSPEAPRLRAATSAACEFLEATWRPGDLALEGFLGNKTPGSHSSQAGHPTRSIRGRQRQSAV